MPVDLSCYLVGFLISFSVLTPSLCIFFFFFNDTATTEIYTLSLHDALPICRVALPAQVPRGGQQFERAPVKRLELHELLRHVEQPGRVTQLVVPDPERIQRVAAVGVLRQRDGERSGSRPIQPLPHESLAGGEQLFRIEALGMSGDRVDPRRGFRRAAALGVQGREGGGRIQLSRVRREIVPERFDRRGERRLELPAVGGHLLEQRRAGDTRLGHGLGAGGRVPHERLLVRRREPPPTRLARLRRGDHARQRRRIGFEAALDRIDARPEPCVVLGRRIALGAADEDRGGVAECVFFVFRNAGSGPRRLRRAAVVGESGVVVVLPGVHARQRDERLRISGLQAGGEAKQHGRRVFLPALPRGEAGVEGVRPQPAPVPVDVLLALGRDSERARERAVGAGGVGRFDVVAAEVIPGGGVLVLRVLRDRLGEDLPRLLELLVAPLRFLGGGLQVQDAAVDLEVAGAELAGGLGRGPAPLSEQGAGQAGAAQSREREAGAPHSWANNLLKTRRPASSIACRPSGPLQSGRPDSNRRRPAWEAGILPLNYARGVTAE